MKKILKPFFFLITAGLCWTACAQNLPLCDEFDDPGIQVSHLEDRSVLISTGSVLLEKEGSDAVSEAMESAEVEARMLISNFIYEDASLNEDPNLASVPKADGDVGQIVELKKKLRKTISAQAPEAKIVGRCLTPNKEVRVSVSVVEK